MPPADRVQRFEGMGGSDMSRMECFTRGLEHLRSAQACFRGLAHHDEDARWLIAARNMDYQIDQVKKEMNKPRAGRRLIWLPGQA
jgi:hypothetical protein